jgi:Cu2+-containing amine oxidase
MAKSKPKAAKAAKAARAAKAAPRPAAPAARPKLAVRPTPLPSRPTQAARKARRGADDVALADPLLFAPLSEGERADAIRCLLEDERLRGVAKVGRYRVITVEPLVVKPPEPLAGRRLARLVVYDYASDRCVDACVDLDRGAVCHVSTSTAQPMLSRDEEADAVAIADADVRVVEARGIAAQATCALHYWSLRVMDFAYKRRSAAVIYAPPGGRPTVVAVVSLVDREVVAIVPAEKW